MYKVYTSETRMKEEKTFEERDEWMEWMEQSRQETEIKEWIEKQINQKVDFTKYEQIFFLVRRGPCRLSTRFSHPMSTIE